MKLRSLMLDSLAIFFCRVSRCLPISAGSPVDKKMAVDGATLSYVEQGERVPVVFVHGAFSDLRAWEPQREAIARHYRFTAYSKSWRPTCGDHTESDSIQ